LRAPEARNIGKGQIPEPIARTPGGATEPQERATLERATGLIRDTVEDRSCGGIRVRTRGRARRRGGGRRRTEPGARASKETERAAAAGAASGPGAGGARSGGIG